MLAFLNTYSEFYVPGTISEIGGNPKKKATFSFKL